MSRIDVMSIGAFAQGGDLLRCSCKTHRFLTRLHYCAADPSHEGKAQQWGEHEVDHILFMRADVDVDANPEEVSAHRWVAAQGAC